jgi:hypothetical protein
MLEVLLSIAEQCDGVRCDMAMLLLNEVFHKTWVHWPSCGPVAKAEFWTDAISVVKKRWPEFLFMAEAYWDLEPRLHELGFDCVYDKKFYDHVTARDFRSLRHRARVVKDAFNAVCFLENHDEPRIASILSVAEEKAAAVLLLAQPGPRLLHDRQLVGAKRRTPVQFSDYWPEPADHELSDFYERLLTLLPQTVIGRGRAELCDTGLPHCFATKWRDGGRTDLALVNLAAETAKLQFKVSESERKATKIFPDDASSWHLRRDQMEIALAAHGFALLELQAAK